MRSGVGVWDGGRGVVDDDDGEESMGLMGFEEWVFALPYI